MQRVLFGMTAIAMAVAGCATDSRTPAVREFSGLYPIIENGRLGFIDRSGTVVVQPRLELPTMNFLEEDLFSEGVGVARLGSKWGYIDRTGGFVVNPQYDYAGPFDGDLAHVTANGKIGFVDRRGQYVINPQFDGAGRFSEGVAPVKLGEKWGYIDRSGAYVINPQFDDADAFSNGIAAVRSNALWGWIDREGKFKINPQFESVGPFRNGRAVVRAGGKYGTIGADGRYVVNPQFEVAGDSLVEGRWLVFLSGKAGFADETGRLIINPQFDAAHDFSEGLAAVRSNGRWGFVGPDGTYKINPQFDGVTSFSDGFARFSSGNKFGFVDRSGRIVVNPQYDLAGSRFRGGRAWVASEGRLGYIDTDGRLIRPLTPVINATSAAQIDSVMRGVSGLVEPISSLVYHTIRGNISALGPVLLQRAGAPFSEAHVFAEDVGDRGFLASGAHNYHAVALQTEDPRPRKFVVNSPDFDTYLSVTLLQPDGTRRSVGENDDFGGLQTSKVEATPEPGLYVLDVRAFSTSMSGRYRVGVEQPDGSILWPEVGGSP